MNQARPSRSTSTVRAFTCKPIDGKANEALVEWLAKALGVAQSDMTLVRGQTSRRKQQRADRSAVTVARWERLISPL